MIDFLHIHFRFLSLLDDDLNFDRIAEDLFTPLNVSSCNSLSNCFSSSMMSFLQLSPLLIKILMPISTTFRIYFPLLLFLLLLILLLYTFIVMKIYTIAHVVVDCCCQCFVFFCFVLFFFGDSVFPVFGPSLLVGKLCREMSTAKLRGVAIVCRR